jgi:hypothetical protein
MLSAPDDAGQFNRAQYSTSPAVCAATAAVTRAGIRVSSSPALTNGATFSNSFSDLQLHIFRVGLN